MFRKIHRLIFVGFQNLLGAVIFLGHEKNATCNLQTCPSKMADPRTTSSEDLSFVEICLDWSWEDLISDFGKVSQRLETVAGSFCGNVFGRSKNSAKTPQDGFQQNSSIIVWKLSFYFEAFSSLCFPGWFEQPTNQTGRPSLPSFAPRPVHLIGLEGSVTFLGLFISGTLTTPSSLAS